MSVGYATVTLWCELCKANIDREVPYTTEQTIVGSSWLSVHSYLMADFADVLVSHLCEGNNEQRPG